MLSLAYINATNSGGNALILLECAFCNRLLSLAGEFVGHIPYHL
jgi:hypothetical protein